MAGLLLLQQDVQTASSDYTPRHPEESLLYRVVAEQLETFLARRQERDRAVPGFVEEEFRSFLRCGLKEFGFLRLHCDTCRKDRLLPFSCKGGRAFCPSCGGRRMADAAAHLVDRVMPAVPVYELLQQMPSDENRAVQAAARILEIQKRVKPDPEGWTVHDYINHGRP